MATTVRRTRITLPAAPIGPENPLPALLAPDDVSGPDGPGASGDRTTPHDPDAPRTLLPVRRLDAYGRRRVATEFDALVVENDRLRVTVLPALGGRVHSLLHKPSGRELLHRNPVVQPADFGLAGAWCSGGIEWNSGATGHTTLTCAPVHAARVPAPDGGEMLRLWEWERLRDLPFQVDLWLPDGSDFLYVGVRVRNPHQHTVPAYWWSNAAVPETEGLRVLAPADHALRCGDHHGTRRVDLPRDGGTDITYPTRSLHAADCFYDVPAAARPWIAALDADGRGLVQTSTAALRGRKLFVWGTGPGGRRWQEWLTEPGTGGYAEIQAGLAPTQREYVHLEGGAELSWLEAYGPLAADPAAVHGTDWTAARAAAGDALEAALPGAEVDAAHAAWLPQADVEPKEVLATGSGWGALEVLHDGFELPGTPFETALLGEEQRPWERLLHTGTFPESSPGRPAAPGPTLVAPHWRELLEAAEAGPLTEYHLGVAQWHAGDRAQAVRSWERSLRHAETWWTLRCLAVADAEAGHAHRAADRHAAAFRLAAEAGDRAGAALAREAVPALLAAGRADEAQRVLEALRPADRERGRMRLLAARVLLALGRARDARAVFDEGFEVEDLREGEESLHETWDAIALALVADGGPVTGSVRERARREHPLPATYDFRMRPAT
ncbi:DUF5107 domain-containing protein [Streptomyces sp. PTM05]|uniref:DUF5107 domain-containing protein n=1 Tax=Streptantibioticus parmotrematis TaxID=2873249 RepID=A0ABS7QXJ4_9ACTN|nr:DUF5107 domain-containing protein [Streptantibioticus parmotrematis]MBY8887658.1 DUF5107 domain-containing protein [Streptantibioticus parmotrematis]